MLKYRLLLGFLCILYIPVTNALLINTILGQVEENNPAVLDILNSQVLLRLRNVDQSGPEPYYNKNFPKLSRFDHSLGVYALLKKFNLPITQQIAGLLHDSSHTVFSHVGDLVFQQGAKRKTSYQDDILLWYLQEHKINKILDKYNIKLEEVVSSNNNHNALKKPYPYLNADRIEYNLHTALVFNDISSTEAEEIVKNLAYNNDIWYFTDLISAKKFAKLSTYYTKNLWGSGHNVAIYQAACALLKYSLKNDIISKNDLIFGEDNKIIDILNNSQDRIVKDLINIISNVEKYFLITEKSNYDTYHPLKMRGLDPLILHQGTLTKLSELSVDFANEYNETKAYADNGVYLKYKNIDGNILDLIISSNV